MKGSLIIFCLLAFCFAGQTQELVPNGGFEFHTDCPPTLSGSGYFLFVNGVDTLNDRLRLAEPWYCPSSGTSDYFHSCAQNSLASTPLNNWGNALAAEGEGYAAFIAYHNIATDWESSPPVVDYTEYLQTPLAEPLIVGAEYQLSFQLRLATKSRFAIDQIGCALHEGAFVADDSIYYGRLDIPAQLLSPVGEVIDNKESWREFSTSFTAVHEADHLTIGRFVKIDELTIDEVVEEVVPVAHSRAIYYVDAVSLELISIPSNISVEERIQTNAHILNDGTLWVSTPGSCQLTVHTPFGRLLGDYSIVGSEMIQLPHHYQGIIILKSSTGFIKKLFVP